MIIREELIHTADAKFMYLHMFRECIRLYPLRLPTPPRPEGSHLRGSGRGYLGLSPLVSGHAIRMRPDSDDPALAAWPRAIFSPAPCQSQFRIQKMSVSFDLNAADAQLLLAAQAHIGSKNVQKRNEPYLAARRADGVSVININKTWQKIHLAARIIAAVPNPADVVAVSARTYGQRAVLKFASHTGATAMAGRFTPGIFTNQLTKSFKEPRLIIVTDPRTDAQAIREASYVNIPVIALADLDCPVDFVDVAIPCNNKSKHSLGLIWWMLAREVLRLRGTLPNREDYWSVMPDLYFYRDPQEAEAEALAAEQNAAAVAASQAAAGDFSLIAERVRDWNVAQEGAAENWAEEEAEWSQPPQEA